MREYLKEKKDRYLLSVLIILFVISVGLIILLSTTKREFGGLKSQYSEISLLKDDFITLKAKTDAVERRKKLTKISGIIPALDDVFSSLGLKGKIKSIRPVGNRVTANNVEDDAEVSIEKIGLNEMVNLFYKIENAPMLMVLKKADMKTSFEKSDLMNLTLTISLVYEK